MGASDGFGSKDSLHSNQSRRKSAVPSKSPRRGDRHRSGSPKPERSDRISPLALKEKAHRWTQKVRKPGRIHRRPSQVVDDDHLPGRDGQPKRANSPRTSFFKSQQRGEWQHASSVMENLHGGPPTGIDSHKFSALLPNSDASPAPFSRQHLSTTGEKAATSYSARQLREDLNLGGLLSK